MPTTVINAFAAADLVRGGVVRWGEAPPTSHSGVYVVTLSNALNDVDASLERPNFSDSGFESWLAVCPALKLDGSRPSLGSLRARIESFWIADEVILYIGLATNLSQRLRQYYGTPIGAPKPHSGGYFLKLLSNINDLWVHYAECDDPHIAEGAMLARFCDKLSGESRRAIFDPQHPFPFANLEWPHGIRKAHGLRGARSASAHKEATRATAVVKPRHDLPATSPSPERVGAHRTQQITAKDLDKGQIRIPSTSSAGTKTLFPPKKSQVDVLLRGSAFSCSWNPQMGPDRERSGILAFGRGKLQPLVGANEVLTVKLAPDGRVVLECQRA